MSVNSKIKNAISPIVSAVCANVYKGTAKEYCTFRYDTIPNAYADDEGNEDVYSVQVHYCCPLGSNNLTKRNSLRTALATLGTAVSETDATDDLAHEYVYSFQMVD